MKSSCVKIKIKKECIEDVRVWFKTLKERKNEVLETLKNEGAFVESVFLDMQGVDYYLIYYMKAEDFTRVYDIFRSSNLPIDQYHKQCWQAYCEERTVLEELLDIDRIS